MTALLLRGCGKMFRLGHWRLAAAVLALSLSGCAGWGVHDEGLRDNDLSQVARKARAGKKDSEQKDTDGGYLSFDEKGRQIERDLAPQ